MAQQRALMLFFTSREIRDAFQRLASEQRGLQMFPWIKSAVDFVTSHKIP